MPILLTKDGVRFDRFGSNAAILAAGLIVALRLKRDLTVTCGTDSHPETDPHTQGAAVDFRASDLSDGQIVAAVGHFTELLGPKFTVLYESPTKPIGVLAPIAYVNPKATGAHLHVQFAKGVAPLTYRLVEVQA
jgi:hypothetical protein